MSLATSLDEELLDLARRECEEAEVYTVETDETPVTFESNRLKGILTRSSRTTALRVIKSGRIGFAAGAGVQDARALLDIALETAQFGAEARFNMPVPAAYATVDVYDPAIETVQLDDMVQAGQAAIDAIVAHTPGIICEGNVSRRTVTIHISNTAGIAASCRHSVFSARVEGTLIRGTDMLFVGDFLAASSPELDLSVLSRRTTTQLEQAREVVAAPRGQIPVVFTPRSFAQTFATPLSLGFNGKTVLQGASPLAQALGQRRFDPRVTIQDDPTLPMRPGSRPFDDEGVPAQRLSLVEAGVVRQFLYDLQTAGMAGRVSTGSAERSATGLPAPDISVLVVAPGNTARADLLASIDEGIVVEEMIGSNQGNVLGGDFSGNVLLGFKIERGRIAGRVKDTMVAGNVYDVLGDLQGISIEREWIGGSICAPWIVTRRAIVSAKS